MLSPDKKVSPDKRSLMYFSSVKLIDFFYNYDYCSVSEMLLMICDRHRDKFCAISLCKCDDPDDFERPRDKFRAICLCKCDDPDDL